MLFKTWESNLLVDNIQVSKTEFITDNFHSDALNSTPPPPPPLNFKFTCFKCGVKICSFSPRFICLQSEKILAFCFINNVTVIHSSWFHNTKRTGVLTNCKPAGHASLAFKSKHPFQIALINSI